MLVTQLKKVSKQDVELMIQLTSTVYSDFENNSFNRMAAIISKEFKVDCTEFDIENYYLPLLSEDYELESRKVECDYENRIRFK